MNDFFLKHYILKEIFEIQPDFLKNKNKLNTTITNFLLFNDKSNIKNTTQLKQLIKKIITEHKQTDKPLSKIFKRKHFYNEVFSVNENVLCPRKESEKMLEKIIELEINPQTILDLGTGSGALAICLKKIFPQSQVTAIDISTKALEIAQTNSKNLNTNIKFIQNNWLNNWNTPQDLLISNPPYLESHEITRQISFDPINALTSENVLDFYKAINEKSHLFKYIIMEINPRHKDIILNMFENSISILDYNNQPRFILKN